MTIRAVLLVTLLFAPMIQPSSVWGQKTSKVYRVGWVHVASPPVGPPLEVFRARLAEHGYVEGSMQYSLPAPKTRGSCRMR